MVKIETTVLGGGQIHQTTAWPDLRLLHRPIEGGHVVTGGLVVPGGGLAVIEGGPAVIEGGLAAIEGGHVVTGDGHVAGGLIPEGQEHHLEEGLLLGGPEHHQEGLQLEGLHLEGLHPEGLHLEGHHREGLPQEGPLLTGEPEARLDQQHSRRHKNSSWRSFVSKFWRNSKILLGIPPLKWRL